MTREERNEAQRRRIAFMGANPHLSVEETAQQLGVTPKSVYNDRVVMKRLRDAKPESKRRSWTKEYRPQLNDNFGGAF